MKTEILTDSIFRKNKVYKIAIFKFGKNKKIKIDFLIF